MNKDIKSRCKAFLKRFRLFYLVYYYVLSLLINLLKIFVKTDDKLILFVCFGGRRFADSPRAIYEYMLKDDRFKEYKFVWGLLNPEDYLQLPNKVKLDTFSFFYTSLKARCWITNVLVERGLNYTGKKTFYLHTGHGSPIKRIGQDEHNRNHFASAAGFLYDASLAQSDFERKIRSRIYDLEEKDVYLIGAPTNDVLGTFNEDYRQKLRHQLGISDGVKAILYAPTFREYRHAGTFDPTEADFKKWIRKLGDGYIILYRAHPIAMTEESKPEDWFIDVSSYDSIEDLMIASDILVSDYSGMIPDYSIMHKPIYLWTYDFDDYEKARGLYFDIRKVLPYSDTEDGLIYLILNGFTDEQRAMVESFQQKYATVYGHATEQVVDIIYDKIKL